MKNMGNYNRKVNEMFDRNIELNNGVKIPQLGLGTWFIDDDKVADAVKAAVEIGYRHPRFARRSTASQTRSMS